MAEMRLACELTQTESVPIPVPTAGTDKGEVLQIGVQWGFAFAETSSDESSEKFADTVLMITKAAVAFGAKGAGTIPRGAKLYWNNSGKVLTTDSSGGKPYFGYCRAAAASADTEVEIVFDRTGDL